MKPLGKGRSALACALLALSCLLGCLSAPGASGDDGPDPTCDPEACGAALGACLPSGTCDITCTSDDAERK